ncbi:YceD family protein [uncultured Azonexus sp.]|uniref:YceD family protein n=1 Tax=uncultured Azonexus sp. TaxID=520307 RepID=UPI002614F842|nr:YceD family protein [uncultured Azonexus sp.]
MFLTWRAKNNIIRRLSRNRFSLKRINDAFAFARDARVLQGTLAVSAMERLHDLLAEVSGEVSWHLEGFRGKRGEPLLRLTVSGCIPLACQRCLDAIDFELDVDRLLEVIPANADVSQDELEDDSRDFLPVEKELDVAELVEDEILLSLPVAPRHDGCGLPGASGAGERVNPFAALAGLKGKPN